MTHIGYKLSSEEHPPGDLIANGRRAEEAGFSFAAISDHYHPWIDRQGHSPFVWGVLGGLAAVTERIELGTFVTCPLIRIHPALVAHAAGTIAAMLSGRFFLGLGTGENLNEHVLGDRWPPSAIRRDMLEEAVTVIRKLWEGGQRSHHGRYYTIENARVYDLPDQPVPIYLAAAGAKAAQLGAKIGDGIITVAPDPQLIRTFEEAGGKGPRYAEVHVCWGHDEDKARQVAYEWWPNIALKGELGQELATPAHFKQAAEMVTDDDVAEVVACGPDPDRHIEEINKFVDAGYDHVCVHQIGPDQEGFFAFYEREILPRL
jgi:coenzyme F420-dependent glucose-6-phosphate dehydrogenase